MAGACSKLMIAELEAKAKRIRRDILEMGLRAGGCHLAPALSSADLVTALYFRVMRINPQAPEDDLRDRFLLSAGHKCAVQYVALAHAGYFPLEVLGTFSRLHSILGGHPGSKIPGVETPTGSLGHGLPIGVGLALGAKLQQKPYRVFVLLGDGEVPEGSNWEAAAQASQFKLDNLVAIIDRNRLCTDGTTEEVLALEPHRERWSSFGWAVREIDGHAMGEIVEALEAVPYHPGRPSLLIANTIKGKGISFIENRVEWHYRIPAGEEIERARRDLS
ncbi:MAG: transketolase [candidate division NC10 bacterium]|nr:transketolase [candidate division NC10 bacterium]